MAEADSIINSFALVNALILTIPFGAITGLNVDYWDSLYESLKDCEWNGTFQGVFNGYNDCNFAVAYTTMTTLLLCIMYYILRPKEHLFGEWWRRGRWVITFVLIGSTISIIAMLTLFGTLASFYTYRSGQLCATLNSDNAGTSVTTGIVVILSIFATSLLLMA